jgi:hypothetical protein
MRPVTIYLISFLIILITVRCTDRIFKQKQAIVLQPLDSRMVQVEGEIGRRIDITIHNNLAKIDIDNVFLHHFRNKSANPSVRDGFVGIGMLLDALVRFAYYSEDNYLINLKEYVTGELIKTQESDGYLGIFTPDKRMQGWDTHEGGYIIYALTSDYTHFQKQKSLEAAKKYADLLIDQKAAWITGLEDAFLALYRATNEQKYLAYCINDFGLPEFREGSVHHSRHVYGYLERVLMQLKLYQIKPDNHLLYKPHVAVEYLVNMDGIDIIGSSGMWEHMNSTQEGDDSNAETCATAYLIRLMHHLLQIEGNPFYGDIMERSIYNALFAAQSPDGRKLRYFTDYESAKEYYPDDYFCCPNNFRRMIADLPGLLYYQTENGIAVNLYNQSRAALNIKGKRIEIEQATDYPTSGDVSILLHPEQAFEFDVFLRIPLWCKNAQLKINSQPASESVVAGAFYKISKIWKKGDVISLNLPMEWRFVAGRQRQWQKAALMRGPVVYTMSNHINTCLTEERDITINPNSVGPATADDAYRPGGLYCRARTFPENEEIVFTEFIDPTGIKTFFKIGGSDDIRTVDEFVAKHY